MSNRPAGRRPRHVRDIDHRHPSDLGGHAVLIELRPLSGQYIEDWYPGDARTAVVAAVEKYAQRYPDCRIAHVQPWEWHDWVTLLHDRTN